MGYALARSAVESGAEVVLISGPTSLPAPSGLTFHTVETTQQMYEAVSREFESCDCLIMAAAPADYRPARPSDTKLKKRADALALELVPTVDILREMGLRKRPGQVLVGFALETDHGLVNAREKLRAKNLDMVVLNSPSDPHSAFDHDTNQVTIIVPGAKPRSLDLMPKSELAIVLLDAIARML
jgi:phosphopantothenoylcysteine decarboxylase/phosphopantothenate--cysteine ligase